MQLLQIPEIADQNGGKMWERQIVEMMSLFFLHERSRRVEEVKVGDSRCGSRIKGILYTSEQHI